MTSVVHDSRVYLRHYLAPLQAFLSRDDVTDLYINRPGELWVETLGGAIERHDIAELSTATLDRLARQIAALAHQGISREHPLLSASLPDGARIQIIAPPATRGPMALAIRKHLSRELRLDDYAAAGAFDTIRRDAVPRHVADDETLARLKAGGDFAGLLKEAVRQRRNILIAGGTATGKTTFLNALISEIAAEERLILIEDTPELELRHANAVGLVAARSPLGEAIADMEQLLNASLRMRPDRIILGELRGPEAFTFLRAVNTGHPGSMTTIHADSPARAVEQIALLVLQTGTRLDRDSVMHYVRSTVDVFVQLARTGGRRHVADVVLRSDA
ncbi:MAG: P-type DNA transfer ATPase VirB11 [Sphingomonadales bacterium]|nr:P-type DNA transfer ATPase VirB11 [Sphingomonadales bacterium]MBK6492508.1 P-type DNA transfer ATPase VirB11 [Sphingomonadales bacterium]MBK6720619.1 P-type DNA transfer ATPase VirB11 [Sphingomonadales bacterium]MBK7285335.1 P-type DNA transfer ATPase VirB11 [Sphingomonadales bacterium]MBK8273804.1 P-type DNA transfer ATPase VirB11 [Sphingomonadales bacterium]